MVICGSVDDMETVFNCTQAEADRESESANWCSRTKPKGRDGGLLDGLFALLDLRARLAHASLLVPGEFGVATSLFESLRLRRGGAPFD